MGPVNENQWFQSITTTLDDYIQQVTPLGFNHPTAWKITRSIAEMIALDNQPFSIVDDVGFTCVMKVLEPRYATPSRRYFAEVAISAIFGQVKEAMGNFFAELDYLSCTTDIWSSVAQNFMLRLTSTLHSFRF